MINKDKIDALLQVQDTTCVSIYVPTYRAGHNQEDRIRFKNALRDATLALANTGMREKEAKAFLKAGYALLEDQQFWLHLSDGLAVFFSADKFECLLLPHDVRPFSWVGNHFYLRPLLPVLTGRQRFFLLALSQNEVRFFEGNKYHITPVKIKDLVPENREAAVALDAPEPQLQAYSGSANGQSIYHGQGQGEHRSTEYLRQYLRAIDKGLMKMLHDEQEPLILAAVDHLVPIYREISSYGHIVDAHISGNPEQDDPVLLHEKAWAILAHHGQNQLAQQRQEFPAALSEEKASTELTSILQAALSGRVETLFLNKKERLWGQVQPDVMGLAIFDQQRDGSEDLLEILAMKTYENGGEVYNVAPDKMPDANTLANAVFRY
ncbi:MAG: hypothetical protein KDC44_22840 [Phaeodactylibacter sp.]|nr:hypothetical protein [Phaeodactylibacter sp.]